MDFFMTIFEISGQNCTLGQFFIKRAILFPEIVFQIFQMINKKKTTSAPKNFKFVLAREYAVLGCMDIFNEILHDIQSSVYIQKQFFDSKT